MHAAAASSSSASASRKDTRRNSSCNGTNAKLMGDLEELVEETKETKNWKSIVIALLVIVTVLGLVITTIVLVTPAFVEEKPIEKLSFKDFLEGKYEPRKIDPIWFSGEDAFIYRNSLGELILVNCSSNESSVFMSNSSFRELNTNTFILSPDRQYVLFLYNIRQVYTYSRTFYAKIFNTHTRLFADLYGPVGYDIQYATWLPNENTVIFVQENNIYSRKVSGDAIYYITQSGLSDVVFNGIPDWLYGERIFQSDNTIWISPTSLHLVYAEIDDASVTKYKNVVYGNPAARYSTITFQSYPKAGSKNPNIKLKLFDMMENTTHTLPPPSDFRNRDYYITLVNWLTKDMVLVKWLNRPQNISVVTVCKATEASCRENFRYSSETGWIHTPKQGLITTGENEYFMILPQRHMSSGSYEQIARIDSTASDSNGRQLFLTSEKSEVVKLVGYNRIDKTLYYIAIPENDTKTRHLYSITSPKDDYSSHVPTCLTCDNKDCEYSDASFSLSGQFYILVCLGPSIPNYILYASQHSYVRELEANIELQTLLHKEMLPKIEYYHIPAPNTDKEIHVQLVLPSIYNKEELLKYNIMVFMGQDPESHMANQKFRIGWEHVMASVHSIFVAFVDTRGHSGRGSLWRHGIYRNVGKLAVDDVFTAIGHLTSLPFVHETLAIFGSEYGGHMVSSVLTREQSAFSCGLAVSPITDWRYMDSFYAERYMGFPASNLNNYNDAIITKYASKLKDKNVMLIHGTGDDRVHFQHTAQLTKSLSKSGITFKSQIYPDAKNLFSDKSIQSHVYFTMEKHILECFDLPRVGNEHEVVQEEVEEE